LTHFFIFNIQAEKQALGNDAQHPEISMIVRGKFCSTLTMVLSYGIKASSAGMLL